MSPTQLREIRNEQLQHRQVFDLAYAQLVMAYEPERRQREVEELQRVRELLAELS